MDWVANRREFLRLTFRTLGHRHSDAGYQGPIYNNNSVNRKKPNFYIPQWRNAPVPYPLLLNCLFDLSKVRCYFPNEGESVNICICSISFLSEEHWDQEKNIQDKSLSPRRNRTRSFWLRGLHCTMEQRKIIWSERPVFLTFVICTFHTFVFYRVWELMKASACFHIIKEIQERSCRAWT